MKLLKYQSKFIKIYKKANTIPAFCMVDYRSEATVFTDEEAFVFASFFNVDIVNEKPLWVLQKKGSNPKSFMYSEINNEVADFYFAAPERMQIEENASCFGEHTPTIVGFDSKAEAIDFVNMMSKINKSLIGLIEYVEYSA